MHAKNLSLPSRLVVGFTASNLDSSLALLSDMVDLPAACRPRALVICCDKVEAGQLRSGLDSFGGQNIKTVLVPKDKITNAALSGQFGEYYSDRKKQVGIAFHRTVLHHFLYREAIGLPNPVVWILDDDVRLEQSCFVEDPRTGESRLSETLARMTAESVDIAIGKVCGDPPIPGASMIRTQLLDLDFNLRALRNPDFSVDYEQLERQKMENARKYADYYYDLTLSHGGHLETPWYYASESGSTNRLLILEEMLRRVRLIEYGVNVFRPLPASAPANPESNPMLPTRGGNTFVLSVDCLREYPNIAPWIQGVPLRRGDTLWAILNKRLSSKGLVRKTVSIDFPVLQDRKYCRTSIGGIDVLLADILGGALTRAVNQTLRIRNNAGERADDFEERRFTTAEIKEIERIFEELTKERLALLLLNSWRIQGLVDSIRAQMDEMLRQDGEEGAVLRKYVDDVEGLLSLAQETFSPGAIAVLRIRALGYSKSELEDFLSNLESYSASYRSKLPTIEGQASPDEALSFLKDKFGDRKFELLAKGGEAVVFSDGTSVYKYFHHGVENFQEGQLEFLQGSCSAERLGWAKRIAPVERVLIDGHKVLFVSKFVDGHQYDGGMLSEILELLRECRRAGIVLTNISPKNFVVTDDSLTYVDIGRSVEPLDEDGYLEMCRRAYLVYRWHFKAELQELLRRAIHNDSLPEAFGFESFMASLRELDSHDLLDLPLLNLVATSKPRRILDYGCGNGGVADKLSQTGAVVTAYDIDSTRYLQHPHKDNVELVDRERINQLMASGSVFDAVVCTLVLCSVEDEGEIRQIVEELRKLVDDEGAVVVAICNPFGWQTEESETHVKQTPPTAGYSNHFRFTKMVKVTRGSRIDYHRPLSWYLSTFRRAGLEVESLVETPGTDVQRLAPSGDFMLLRLRPTSVPEKSDVSLLIKTCGMEWRTIRKQIEHVVGQLEGPRLFREKVVLVDSYQGPFARQYDSADIRALMKVLDSLVEEGVIDRVLETPTGDEWAAALNRRWFGLDGVASRAENGQPTLATLHGFEKCMGEYVLHIDSDCMVGRSDLGFDYLLDMLEIFESDPDCVTISLPVASRSRRAYTNGDGKAKWRTEVRCGIMSKSRLERLLPLRNSVSPIGLLDKPWHRALDDKLRESAGQSYRGGGPEVFFVHVPNERKREFNSWYNIMKAVEQGRLYEGQLGNVDLVGAVDDWLPRRSEEFVVILRGRNVPVAKLRRCFDSLESQTDQEWGLVVIDAGSDNGMEEYIEEVLMRKYSARMTFYRNLISAPPVANIYFAVRGLCDNPESVVLMPDADDAFLCADSVTYIKREYAKGADLAIGGMVRSDKDVYYSSNFHEPRSSRGGNVWQPLRTFKKHLFDRVNPDDLKVDGDWVPHTEDWAFMLPMAEMAESPIQFDRMIYYYDPSSLKEELPKEEREALIARIMAKPRYRRADNA